MKTMVIAWAATFLLGLAPQTEGRYPVNWSRSFEVSGRSASWRVQSLFSPADFGPYGQGDLGFEFSTGNMTYTGEPVRLRWYRMEVLLPEELTIRVRPGPPDRYSACAVDTRYGVSTTVGEMTRPGATFYHGHCDVYPWSRSADELASKVTKGLYVVTWEDDSGVHAEVLPLSKVQWQ